MKYLIMTTLLTLSFNTKATDIQWQESGTCILAEQRLYDESADYPTDFMSKGYIQAGADYYLYDLITVKTDRSVAELKLKGSLTHNESLHLQVHLPNKEGSLGGMSISVKSNQEKFRYNTDLFAKGDEFLDKLNEKTSPPRQFVRSLQTRTLLPRQVELLKLDKKISTALQKKKEILRRITCRL